MQDERYKRCSKCGGLQLRECFSPDGRKSDGLQSACKACAARYARQWREKNPEKQREQGRRKWTRIRAQPDEYREHLARGARWRAANRDYSRQMSRAHVAVERALEKGVLVRPDACERCGATGRIEAHHDDHDMKLDVRWLCVTCHRAADKARRTLSSG